MNLQAYQDDYKQNPPEDSVNQTFWLSGGEDGSPMVRIPTADLGTFPIETMCGTVGDKTFDSRLIKRLQSLPESHIVSEPNCTADKCKKCHMIKRGCLGVTE